MTNPHLLLHRYRQAAKGRSRREYYLTDAEHKEVQALIKSMRKKKVAP